MSTVKVHAGVCGFTTIIKADSEDQQMANIEITTNCPSLKPMEKEQMEVDGFAECFGKVGQGEIFTWCQKYCKHPACPVPTGIVKAVEVACELALPKDVSFEISK